MEAGSRRAEKENMGMIFQHFNSLYSLSENIAYPLGIGWFPKEGARSQGERADPFRWKSKKMPTQPL